ncbi:MAG: deoxyguanosinetriphosphate triphosphohydrolase, partial [Candidatus Omnitrophica bacterium]|nr:deoxyguanosinetriphosphate triphosphohydrolase [Candidatus Omnitrophota bacterium]
EQRYPEFPGLNLSWEVREGIVKHSSKFDTQVKLKEFSASEMPTLETQVVDMADEIAYDNHDLDDGLTSGLIKEEDLAGIPLWKDISDKINSKYPGIEEEKKKYLIIRSLIDIQATDLIRETEAKIKKFGFKSYKEIKKHGENVVNFSKKMLDYRIPLRQTLMLKLYQHYRVIRMSEKAKRFIKELFELYMKTPQALPAAVQKNIPAFGKIQVVCDYIAGMTD